MEKSRDDFMNQLIEEIKKISYIKAEDIPNIELYMDQVTTYMDKRLKPKIKEREDKMLTKTMINNYTKNDLLPPPNKKKYSKEHMILLIFIYYFKNILSITDIQNILNPLTELYYQTDKRINLEDIYNEVFGLEKDELDILVNDVMEKYSRSKTTFQKANEEESEFLTTFSMICMLSFDVYMKKAIIERLISQTMEQRTEKNGKEKPKKKKEDKDEKER
ncbi:DUF1836 domain-containing protein [Anaerosporobacter faecicola]|uniref:DUF1836 domain-containing protein n=1 Tax=Anaerosporobacter faecicola TaxID=2718714 RepID=UPI001439D518|nr:DUF1836 domain-containing protein [Anaerosporobacter faecicola]